MCCSLFTELSTVDALISYLPLQVNWAVICIFIILIYYILVVTLSLSNKCDIDTLLLRGDMFSITIAWSKNL